MTQLTVPTFGALGASRCPEIAGAFIATLTPLLVLRLADSYAAGVFLGGSMGC